MANPCLLNDYFEASGKTKVFLAERLNVSRPRLDTIFEKPDTATVGQADILCVELAIITSKDKHEIFLP